MGNLFLILEAIAGHIPFATDEAVSKAIFTVELPLSAELLRSGLSKEQVALAMELGMAIFTEDYCGVRAMTKGGRMAVDAKAARIGLAKDVFERAANRLDARLSWHFRQDVEDMASDSIVTVTVRLRSIGRSANSLEREDTGNSGGKARV